MNTRQSKYVAPIAWRQTQYEETYKSQIEIIIESLKLLGWANGSTVLALLGLIVLTLTRCQMVVHVELAVVLAAVGVVFVIFAFFLSYLSQMYLLKHLHTVEFGPAEDVHGFPFGHVACFLLAGAATVASIAFFLAALLQAYFSLASFSCNPQ